MYPTDSTLKPKKIFLFWVPLAATWLMMAAEGPFIAAVIARLPDPKFNLAAFGVAFSLAILIESPIIMIMSASTALVRDGQSFIKLRRFTNALNVAITMVMVVGLIPPVFDTMVRDLIGLPENIARLTHLSFLCFLPWPVSIGIRRFYQGILIRNDLTRRIAYGTVIRLSSMASTALGLYFFADIPGALSGALAASTGVFCEAIACRMMAAQTVKSLIESEAHSNGHHPPLEFGFIVRFYTPLALTSILALGVHPMVTFFLGTSRFPIESLAVLPVVNSLVFIFRSLGLSFQEVVIALSDHTRVNQEKLKNFALALGVLVSGLLMVIAVTPLARIWFVSVSGLSPRLADFAYLPAQVLILLPGLTVWISFQRGMLVSVNQTVPIITATVVEVIVIALTLHITIFYLNFIGVVAAGCAYILGRFSANLFLLPAQLKVAPGSSRE